MVVVGPAVRWNELEPHPGFSDPADMEERLARTPSAADVGHRGRGEIHPVWWKYTSTTFVQPE
jgi:hypothetical protein